MKVITSAGAMDTSLPRRKFLRAVAAATTAAGVPLQAQNAAGDAGPAPVDSAASEAKKPRLLVGCCAYSFSKYLESGRMTMEDFIVKAVDLGVHGVDITTYWLKSTEPSRLTQLRNFAYRHAMPFSGAAIGATLCQPDPSKRDQELEKIKQWVDRTEWLGAAHLRVFGGEIPSGASEEQALRWVVETMKPACDYASKKGVILGIESHGGITSKAATIADIIRRVDSPFAGVNLDISNFNEDPYTQIEACIPYATHTHIRDYYGERREPLDLERVWQMFSKGGYEGYMSAEYEAEEDAMTGVPKLLAKIKTLCQKYSSA